MKPNRFMFLVLAAVLGCVNCSPSEMDAGGDKGGACGPDELCVILNATETTGNEIRFILYEADERVWPNDFQNIPPPDWVVLTMVPVPNQFPDNIRIPLAGNTRAIKGGDLDGATVGLAVLTGQSGLNIVDPTDARGFSSERIRYQPGLPLDFGSVELRRPRGSVCEINPYNPRCLTGGLFWKAHLLGEEGFIPGAIYMDTGDLDGDGVLDIAAVGLPQIEDPLAPNTDYKLGVYYMTDDLGVRESIIVDSYTAEDPGFYGPWGVKIVDQGGEPMIIVGTGIPGMVPTVDGVGTVWSYRKGETGWVREAVLENPDPNRAAYNMMVVVPCDIDHDGDRDLILSGAGDAAAVGSWMENTGHDEPRWIPHLKERSPDTDPNVRLVLAYTCKDITGDGYPEVLYNSTFLVPNTSPPASRGEIWLAINPGEAGDAAPWRRIVVDEDNHVSADMIFGDFNQDGHDDIVANQIFDSTATLYLSPGGDLSGPWQTSVLVSGLTSPSDMYLADMDGDGLEDIVTADNAGHAGVWNQNPGPGPKLTSLWPTFVLFKNIRLPGDFVIVDQDQDGDLDWVGTSMTRGQALVVEQIKPPAGLVATISVPTGFNAKPTKMFAALFSSMPASGPPDSLLAMINNTDADGDGALDVDQIIGDGKDFVLAVEDVHVTGEYYLSVGLYVEGGGMYQPVSGLDYLAYAGPFHFGSGTVVTDIALSLAP